MSELISHTPTWVFAIFFTLLVLGFIQSKERIVKVNSVFILPISMVVFSLFGVLSVFGITISAMGFWITGLIVALIWGIKLAYPKLVSFSAQNKRLTIPGSWAPLIFMMAIFFTKYIVGYAVARELAIVNEFMFMATINILYGAFSGVFLSRSFVMFKASKTAM
ncbi:hypothetical protein L3081_05445 [Colwellia sp. MSW7]|uniref:DUF1453 domain-containing protein n=1 Tax=Colwellia maritima TaxID=2912588 RepID=A0ABS9WYA6_9GAMM|nr:DUF6622 family protein [Colwellia maritima]MCI2282936.1 hypothetical protein [Colwellia maritima]